MFGPSPIHRSLDSAEDDYGAFTDEANAAIGKLVEDIKKRIAAGVITNGHAVIAAMREGLTAIGDGATDTVVKENVGYALDAACAEAGIYVDGSLLYGW